MTFPLSAGVYPRITDKSHVVPAVAGSVAGIVIHSDKGPRSTLTEVTSNAEFINIFGEPETDKVSMHAALAFLEKGNRLVVVNAINDATAATLAVMDTQGTPALTFTVNAANEGVWAHDINITLEDPDANDGHFKLHVTYNGVLVETWRVSKTETLKDGFGNSLYIEDVINGNSDYITVADVTGSEQLPDMTTDANLASGSDDTATPDAADLIAAFQLFGNKDEVDISMLLNAGWTDNTVQAAMITVCETTRAGDSIAILDMPTAQSTVANMVTYVSTTLNVDTAYAAIYAGWPKVYDQYNAVTVQIPPSGFVGGIIAHTAANEEPWFAPAGPNRGIINSATGIQMVFTEGNRDTLYEAGINPIQSFIGGGIQVFGQKTLKVEPAAMQRINVTMLMITIQKAISKTLRSFVFEVNDAFTRENIKSVIEAYMENVKARRGVTDYLVVVDETNNTGAVIDRNEMIIDLHVKPTRTAEFIRLNTIVSATGASFTTTV